MSTRALIRVFDENNEPIVCIYKHFDGYPSGLGVWIKEAFNGGDCVVKNGIGIGDEIPQCFNGMCDAAAWLVAFLKTHPKRPCKIGDVYLVRLKRFPQDLREKTRLLGAEFAYDIWFRHQHIGITVHSIEYADDGVKLELLYEGPIKNFQPEKLEW